MKNLLFTSCLFSAIVSSALSLDTFSMSSVNGGAAAESPKRNFDDLDLGNSTQAVDGILTVSFTGTGKVVQGAEGGHYAAPFVSGMLARLLSDTPAVLGMHGDAQRSAAMMQLLVAHAAVLQMPQRAHEGYGLPL